MEQIGLEAVLQDKAFREGIKNYIKSLDAAEKETEDAGKKMSKASVPADKLTKSVGGLRGSFDSLKSSVPILDTLTNPIALVTAGVAAFVAISKQSIDAASNFNETMSKTQVIFGDAADEIINKSGTMAQSIGQSKQSFLDASATFGVFGKSAGLVGSDLADFSTDLTMLASDMASFSNTTPEEAIMALGAALRGESEPIRRYGVLLDDASMRQKALALGIISTTKEALTPQQKILAAQALIFEQTADAQGDFARTSDGLANQQRILAAEFENLKIELGNGLLPVAIEVTGALVNMFKAIEVGKNVRNVMEDYEAAVKAGLITEDQALEVQKKMYAARYENVASIEIMTEALGHMGEAELAAGLATEEQYGAMSEASLIAEKYGIKLGDVEDATDGAAIAAADYKDKLSELQGFMSGKLGPEMEDFKEKQGNIITKMGEVKGKIDELNGMSYLTTAQKEELDTLQGEYDTLKGQYEDNADAHEEATKRILLDLVIQRASMDELSGKEYDLILRMAEDWGLIDEATRTTAQEIDKVIGRLVDDDYSVEMGMNQIADTAGYVLGEELPKAASTAANSPGMLALLAETGQIGTNINNIEGYHKVQIDVEVTGDPIPSIALKTTPGDYEYRASGGPVKKGMPYIVGEDGPEFFVPDYSGEIIPSQSISAMASSLPKPVDFSSLSSFWEIGSAIDRHSKLVEQARIKDQLYDYTISSAKTSAQPTVVIGPITITSDMDMQEFTARVESAVLRALS